MIINLWTLKPMSKDAFPTNPTEGEMFWKKSSQKCAD